MFRAAALAFSIVWSLPATAHEFWISGGKGVLSLDDAFTPEVWVGEDLEGERHSWLPQAYTSALWVGPTGVKQLHTAPLGTPGEPLQPLGPGLHTLSVASYEQNLTYQEVETFKTFLRDIGREDLLETEVVKGGSVPIEESYRRLSKTLIYFGAHKGADTRLGVDGEWLRTAVGYKLFYQGAPAARQHARIDCRGPEDTHWKFEGRTNSQGEIVVDLPTASECLINTVFLTHDPSRNRWFSTWISHFHVTM